ncbi:MAG: DOMON-like domain-containing protein [Deltaproteobacteria bacterium]
MPCSFEEIRRDFKLHPFDAANAPPLTLSGSIVRLSRQLQVEFHLEGDLAAISIPPPAAEPKRRHDLWRETCFELFFSPLETSAYHEVNLSPSGHWNLYFFDAYRRGMREEGSNCLKGRILPIKDSLVVRMELDLSPLNLEGKALKAGLCAVLLFQAEKTPSYWALTHPGPRPDFHDQRAWLSLNFNENIA